MNINSIIMWVLIAAVVLGGGYLLLANQSPSTDETVGEGETMMEKESTMMKDEGTMDGAMMEKGTYEPYAPEKLALAQDGKVILYFHADWCPICRGIEREIQESPQGIPSGEHILKVDYDTATELKQKYGVTYQHTFVQVDAQGNLIAKWGDATTLAQVLARIK